MSEGSKSNLMRGHLKGYAYYNLCIYLYLFDILLQNPLYLDNNWTIVQYYYLVYCNAYYSVTVLCKLRQKRMIMLKIGQCMLYDADLFHSSVNWQLIIIIMVIFKCYFSEST